MNYEQLLIKQAEFDEHVEKIHKLPYVRLSKKVLATITELSEVVNDEEQALKYWKANPNPKPTLIEEVADFTHLLASLSNRFKVTADDIKGRGAIKYKELDDHFLNMHHALSMVGVYPEANQKRKHVLILWSLFKGLLEHLNFSEEQVYMAYLLKNKENYERQANSY